MWFYVGLSANQSCKANLIISWTSALLISNDFLALFFAPLGFKLTSKNIGRIGKAVFSSNKKPSASAAELPWDYSTQIILKNQSVDAKAIHWWCLLNLKLTSLRLSVSTTYITWKSYFVKHNGKDPVSRLFPICLEILDMFRPNCIFNGGKEEKHLTKPKERWHYIGTEEYFHSIYYWSKLCTFSKKF